MSAATTHVTLKNGTSVDLSQFHSTLQTLKTLKDKDPDSFKTLSQLCGVKIQGRGSLSLDVFDRLGEVKMINNGKVNQIAQNILLSSVTPEGSLDLSQALLFNRV